MREATQQLGLWRCDLRLRAALKVIHNRWVRSAGRRNYQAASYWTPVTGWGHAFYMAAMTVRTTITHLSAFRSRMEFCRDWSTARPPDLGAPAIGRALGVRRIPGGGRDRISRVPTM